MTNRFPKAVLFAFILVLCVSQIGVAKERRLFGRRSRTCCCVCPVKVIPCTCVITKIWDYDPPNVFVYYAEYNEHNCGDEQAVYVLGNYDEPQICEEDGNSTNDCISDQRMCVVKSDTIPHHLGEGGTFKGFFSTLPPGTEPDWGKTAHPASPKFVIYKLQGEEYKAKRWEAGIDTNGDNMPDKTIYVAFEVRRIPGPGPDPGPTSIASYKRCQGFHAYSIKESSGKNVLLLVDREE